MTSTTLSLLDLRPSHIVGPLAAPDTTRSSGPCSSTVPLARAASETTMEPTGLRSLPVMREASLLRDDLRPSILGGAAVTAPATPLDRSLDGSRPTLDDVLVGAWEGLTSERREVSCLVCGDVMRPRWGATSTPVGGRCDGCGSTLS